MFWQPLHCESGQRGGCGVQAPAEACQKAGLDNYGPVRDGASWRPWGGRCLAPKRAGGRRHGVSL